MRWKLGCVIGAFLLLCTRTSYAQKSLPLHGTLDFAEQKFFVEFSADQNDPFRLEVARISEMNYELKFSVVHWKTAFFDLSMILNGSLKILSEKEEEGSYIVGQLESKHAFFNNRPFDEIFVDFILRDKRLIIRSFRFGPFLCSGKIDLSSNPNFDLTARFSGVFLADILEILQKGTVLDAGGEVDGDIRLQGPIDHLTLRGELNSYHGFVGQHDYSTAQINFEGIYPQIYVDHSYVAQTDGFSFAVQGSLDLSDLASLQKQIKTFVKSPLIKEDGQNLDWTFKRLKIDEAGGSTEFKYMIRKGSGSEEDTGILGIEKKMEF